jgi:phenylacetate-CoA ligase
MVIFKGTNFYPRQIESIILRRPGVSHEYQIVLERGLGGDHLAVLIEARSDFSAEHAPEIEREIRAALHLSVELRVLKEGDLPRPAGKAVRVVDRRESPSSRRVNLT